MGVSVSFPADGGKFPPDGGKPSFFDVCLQVGHKKQKTRVSPKQYGSYGNYGKLRLCVDNSNFSTSNNNFFDF